MVRGHDEDHGQDPGVDPEFATSTPIRSCRERWAALTEIRLRFRAGFAYVDGVLADGEVLRLCQPVGLRDLPASHDDYEDSFLPTGSMGGTAEDALDTACCLYLNDPTGRT